MHFVLWYAVFVNTNSNSPLQLNCLFLFLESYHHGVSWVGRKKWINCSCSYPCMSLYSLSSSQKRNFRHCGQKPAKPLRSLYLDCPVPRWASHAPQLRPLSSWERLQQGPNPTWTKNLSLKANLLGTKFKIHLGLSVFYFEIMTIIKYKSFFENNWKMPYGVDKVAW